MPVYLHDWYGAEPHGEGRQRQVGRLQGRWPSKYRAEAPLTGDESRVAEVQDVPFPKLLDPVDDLPPTTVITHVRRRLATSCMVRGTTADNGTVKRVLVNGKEAKPIGCELRRVGDRAGQTSRREK